MTYCILRNNDFFIAWNWSSSWRFKSESDEPVASWVLPCLCVRCVVDDHSAVTLCQAGPEFICQLPWRNIPELWRVKVWHEILPRLFCSGVASGLVGPFQNVGQQDVISLHIVLRRLTVALHGSCHYSRIINIFKKLYWIFVLYRIIRIFFLNSQVWGTRKYFLLVNNIAGLGGVGWVVLTEADVSLAEISDWQTHHQSCH